MDYQTAIERTDEQYRHFVVDMPRWSKQLKRQVSNAYMAVDGRVMMANDEAALVGEKISVHSSFYEVAGQTVCMVQVETCRGKAVAHARAFLDAESGADATNPLEVAETSAVGRALGFLGYGLFGGGIASADEMERVTDRDSEKDARPVPDMTKPKIIKSEVHNYGLEATEKQLNYIRKLMQQAGYADDVIKTEIETVREDRDSASELIGTLSNDLTKSKAKVDPETVRRKSFWARAREAMQVSGKTEEDLRAYMAHTYQLESTKELMEDQEKELIQWLSEPEDDDIPDPALPSHIEEMPATITTLQLLCDDNKIPWETLESYLEHANKVDDVGHLSTHVIKRTIRAFADDQKGHFVEELKRWKAPKSKA